MPYESGYSFARQEANMKIEVNTGTVDAPVWENLCGLAEIEVDPQLITDTFATLCDGADSTTVIVGRDIKISGTAKYNTENTQLKSLVGAVFNVGAGTSRKMKITIVPYGKILEGQWEFIAGAMSMNKSEVISIPFDLRTGGAQAITDIPAVPAP